MSDNFSVKKIADIRNHRWLQKSFSWISYAYEIRRNFWIARHQFVYKNAAPIEFFSEWVCKRAFLLRLLSSELDSVWCTTRFGWIWLWSEMRFSSTLTLCVRTVLAVGCERNRLSAPRSIATAWFRLNRTDLVRTQVRRRVYWENIGKAPVFSLWNRQFSGFFRCASDLKFREVLEFLKSLSRTVRICESVPRALSV